MAAWFKVGENVIVDGFDDDFNTKHNGKRGVVLEIVDLDQYIRDTVQKNSIAKKNRDLVENAIYNNFGYLDAVFYRIDTVDRLSTGPLVLTGRHGANNLHMKLTTYYVPQSHLKKVYDRSSVTFNDVMSWLKRGCQMNYKR